MRHAALLFVFFATMTAILSCNRDSLSDQDILYGQWQTSYGDTITFARENSKDILTYDMSMNRAMPHTTKNEFTYRDNKLGIKDGFNGNDFRFFESFAWDRRGRSFTVRGAEWFMFVNSANTYFTFTRLR